MYYRELHQLHQELTAFATRAYGADQHADDWAARAITVTWEQAHLEPEQPLTGTAREYAYGVMKRIATSRSERRRRQREVPLAEHDYAHEADVLDRLTARETLAAIQRTLTPRECATVRHAVDDQAPALTNADHQRLYRTRRKIAHLCD